jgi:hypothetical protein
MKMKLDSVPPYPSQVIANGITTNFVRNLTPQGRFQIARHLGEKNFDVLFEGSPAECEDFLARQIEKEFPGLMRQP